MSKADLALGLIVCTSAKCKLKGRSWPDIPTLLWPDGIDEDVSDWLRTLVVDYGVATSSATEYANIIRPFLRFCRQHRRSWQSVDDEFLVIWREHMRQVKNIAIPRVNQSLKTVFAFYRWAEENKRVRFQVGIYTQADLPDSVASFVFPITAKQTFSKGRHGRVFGSWATPLTLSNPRQGVTTRHTPSEKEIQSIHAVANEKEHCVRNTLMFSWAEETGLRRAEFMRLCKLHLPTSEQLAHLIERDEPWLISIERKGGVAAPINALPDLIIQTLDYIEYERRVVVERLLKSKVRYREPDEIFLSGTTGQALHLDSVTAIGIQTFREAGVERASIHRLRARYAVRTVETLVDAIFDGETVVPASSWVETILERAAQMMGHTSARSLRPYLTFVLNRRIQTADANKAENLASRLRLLERHEKTIVQRLSWYPELQRAARHAEAGRNADGVLVLKELIRKLET